MSKLNAVRTASAVLFLSVSSVTAASAAPVQVVYICNLEGQQATMTALVEAVGTSGIVTGPGTSPAITGVIGTGDYTLYYQGELRSPTAYYVFTGENAYADFTDMTTYATFRVQFTAQPDGSLILTANPFGPAPASYLCMPAQQ